VSADPLQVAEQLTASFSRAGQMLDVSASTIRRMVDDGDLMAVKVRRANRV